MLVAIRKNVSTDENPEVRTRVPRTVFDVLTDAKQKQGVDFKQTVARVLTWFSTQESVVRAAILGQFEIDEEVAALLARRMRTTHAAGQQAAQRQVAEAQGQGPTGPKKALTAEQIRAAADSSKAKTKQ